MYYDDLILNQKITLDKVVIDKDKMLAFAKEYDNVPLHTDEEYAKATRFGQIIAPGVMTFMSVWAKYLEKDFFKEQLVAGKSTKIEWFAPVYAGDELCATACVTNLVDRNEYNGLVEVTIEAYNQKGILVLSDVTEAIVSKKIFKGVDKDGFNNR